MPETEMLGSSLQLGSSLHQSHYAVSPQVYFEHLLNHLAYSSLMMPSRSLYARLMVVGPMA